VGRHTDWIDQLQSFVDMVGDLEHVKDTRADGALLA
jgi:hypothetical protein